MKTYEVFADRAGEWWMITIPEIDGLTQTRDPTDAAQMAREYISAALDLPSHGFNIDLRFRV